MGHKMDFHGLKSFHIIYGGSLSVLGSEYSLWLKSYEMDSTAWTLAWRPAVRYNQICQGKNVQIGPSIDDEVCNILYVAYCMLEKTAYW